MSQWVQSKYSKEAEKFEVVQSERVEFWECRQACPSSYNLRLPFSEFVLCSPPEVWEDVTDQCKEIFPDKGIPVQFQGGIDDGNYNVMFERNAFHGMGYRLRKVKVCLADRHVSSDYAFIVEKRKS